MTTPAVTLICATIFLGGFTFGSIVAGRQAVLPESTISVPAPSLPFETRALSGIWEAKWGMRMPSRLVVERLHPEWANVLVAWGQVPGDGTPNRWMRFRARILPGGRLHLAHPLNLTFTLSDDNLDLIGTSREEPRVSLLLRRVAPESTLVSLAGPSS